MLYFEGGPLDFHHAPEIWPGQFGTAIWDGERYEIEGASEVVNFLLDEYLQLSLLERKLTEELEATEQQVKELEQHDTERD